MKVQCSNCMGDVTLSFMAGVVSVKVPASGRGSKRVEASVARADLIDEGALWAWEAPCCPDYWDSLEKT